MTTGKSTALTRWIFAGKVMSLLFNMLSRSVMTFIPRSECLLVSWLHKSPQNKLNGWHQVGWHPGWPRRGQRSPRSRSGWVGLVALGASPWFPSLSPDPSVLSLLPLPRLLPPALLTCMIRAPFLDCKEAGTLGTTRTWAPNCIAPKRDSQSRERNLTH